MELSYNPDWNMKSYNYIAEFFGRFFKRKYYTYHNTQHIHPKQMSKINGNIYPLKDLSTSSTQRPLHNSQSFRKKLKYPSTREWIFTLW